MLEQINIKFFEKRPYAALVLGAVYVFAAFFTSRIFFPRAVAVSMLFLVTVLLVPTVLKLMSLEEKRERKDGVRHFIKDHREIFEIYIFLFIGIFAAFVFLGLFYGTGNFDYQLKFLERQEGLSSELIKSKTETGVSIAHSNFFALVQNNLAVILICFALSFFYGAGSMFLIVLNASVFSAFVMFIIKELPTITHKTTIFLIFLVHTIPELFGFLLAAIAGGIFSKAIIQEKFMSSQFKNVVKDSFLIFLIAVVVIIIAALLETYVTTSLFNAFLVK